MSRQEKALVARNVSTASGNTKDQQRARVAELAQQARDRARRTGK